MIYWIEGFTEVEASYSYYISFIIFFIDIVDNFIETCLCGVTSSVGMLDVG